MTVKKTAVKKAKKVAKSQASISKINNVPAESDIQVLAVCSTESVSGSSTLKYQIGTDANSDIHFRVISSSGSGYVNPIWYSLNEILTILEAHPGNSPFTSLLISSRLKIEGRSNNNVGFLVAVLLQEKILVPFEGEEKFKWQFNSADEFLLRVEKLKSEKK